MYCWLVLLAAFILAVPVAVADDADKDPYLWLEDVTGEKALAWVKERNAESTAELTKSPEFKELESAPQDPRLEGEDPVRLEDGRILLQLLARREEQARPAGGAPRSPNTARPSRTGRPCSTSTRWPRRKRRTGSGTAQRCLRAELRALPGRRCRAAAPTPRSCASSTSTTKEFVEGRLHAARGEERGRLAGSRHASSSAPTSAPAR